MTFPARIGLLFERKGFWFEAPTLDIVPMEVERPINLLQDINIKYYESGEVFASVPAQLNGKSW
jgi:hypothetical protein